jgi:hypothetical protein
VGTFPLPAIGSTAHGADDLPTEMIRFALHRLLIFPQHCFAPCVILYVPNRSAATSASCDPAPAHPKPAWPVVTRRRPDPPSDGGQASSWALDTSVHLAHWRQLPRPFTEPTPLAGRFGRQ